jgi:hypothetical protein
VVELVEQTLKSEAQIVKLMEQVSHHSGQVHTSSVNLTLALVVGIMFVDHNGYYMGKETVGRNKDLLPVDRDSEEAELSLIWPIDLL